MARPVRHQGSGRRGVIPVNWSTDHAVPIADTLKSLVVIRPATGGAPVWNPTSRQTETATGTPVYSGAAKLTAITSPPGGPADVVDEQVPLRVYEVVLEQGVNTALPGLVVDVVSSPDPMLTGARLSINHVDRGDNRFSRVLLATLTR